MAILLVAMTLAGALVYIHGKTLREEYRSC